MNLIVGNQYNVNGTVMNYGFRLYSGRARQSQFWFFHPNGHANHSLLESELEKFVKPLA